MKRVTPSHIALVFLAIAATTQTANADRGHWNNGVNARQVRQQERINQGVQSGQLTGREAAHLEHQQNSLNAQEARMRASGGGLSQSERDRLEREQNALSHNINRQKNDAQRAGAHGWSPNQAGFNGHHGYPNAGQPGFNGQGINAHQENQQERIQQGLQSGQLTKHEYIRLEEKQARFAQLESQLRASGGGLSPQERSRLEFEQRQLSQDIERQRHDSQVR